MAKITHDREDLLRDGTAMPVRGRIRLQRQELIVGWRKDDSCSWFCDLDPVFQFNAAGQLRRVYFHGDRMTCEGGVLCRLERNRVSGDRVELMRVPLDDTQAAKIFAAWEIWRAWADDAFQDAEIDSVGLSPAEFRHKLCDWLTRIPSPPDLADGPGV